jgi:hypothetical protein
MEEGVVLREGGYPLRKNDIPPNADSVAAGYFDDRIEGYEW